LHRVGPLLTLNHDAQNHVLKKKKKKEIKQVRQQNTGLPHICKDRNNTVITQMDKILNRWKEYFSIILNSDLDELSSSYRIQITADTRTDTEILSPSYNEVCSIINKLKSNKAGGTNNIIPELIKQGGRTLKQRIHKLITMICEEEQLHNQWNEGIICLVCKKGDRLDCTNYRPITLLNVAYKIFAIILTQRLVDIAETELGDYQSGFRPNIYS